MFPKLGSQKRCPKCGTLRQTHQKNGTTPGLLFKMSWHKHETENLTIQCPACGYYWKELPLDASPVAPVNVNVNVPASHTYSDPPTPDTEKGE